MSAATPSGISAWADRLGLRTREIRAWALYDCANSAFWTTIVTAVFPSFFSAVASAGVEPAVATARFAAATTLAVTIVAITAPMLGAIADYAALKKTMLGVFMAIGVAATGAMTLVGQGEWRLAAALFIIGNIGVAGSITFYDSLLPHVARPDEVDRVSTAGFAVGFLGGGVLLAINLAWILAPAAFGLPDTLAAIRLSFLSVAVWWLGFSIPLFRHVREPARQLETDERGDTNAVRAGVTRLAETLRELRGYRHAFLMLTAFLLYNDGIQTIIRMAAVYGAEIGIDRNAMIASFVIVQFVGIPFTLLFGWLADRVGPKPSIYVALVVYTGVSVLGYFMSTATHFFLLAILVGMVQGGSQALSRSLFARMIPRHKSSEYFGFFSVFEKFAGIFGPAIFAATIAVAGSSRSAVLSVIAFFVLGGIVLTFVDIEAGARDARDAERNLQQGGQSLTDTEAQRHGGAEHSWKNQS